MVFSDPLFLFTPVVATFSLLRRVVGAFIALLIIVYTQCDIFSFALFLAILLAGFGVVRALLGLAARPLYEGMPPGGEALRNVFRLHREIVLVLLDSHQPHHARVGFRQMIQVFQGSNKPWPFSFPGRSLVC